LTILNAGIVRGTVWSIAAPFKNKQTNKQKKTLYQTYLSYFFYFILARKGTEIEPL